MAKQGDMAAIRLCMDRLSPARKGEPVAFELPPLDKPADSVAAAAEIVAAVAAGGHTPPARRGRARGRGGHSRGGATPGPTTSPPPRPTPSHPAHPQR